MSPNLLQIPLWIALGVAVYLFIVGFFQYLWNMTMPQVFGVREITFWQGFRLLLISGMLFGGWWIHANR